MPVEFGKESRFFESELSASGVKIESPALVAVVAGGLSFIDCTGKGRLLEEAGESKACWSGTNDGDFWGGPSGGHGDELG